MAVLIALDAFAAPTLGVLLIGTVAVAFIIGDALFAQASERKTNDSLNTLQATVDKHGAVLDAVTRHDIRRRTRALAHRIDNLTMPFMKNISKAADAMEAAGFGPYVDATSELQQEMDHILETVASEFIGETRDLILEYHATLHYNNDLMREIAAMTTKLSESRKDCTIKDVNWLARTLYALARTVPWQ
jgi:RNase P protein component